MLRRLLQDESAHASGEFFATQSSVLLHNNSSRPVRSLSSGSMLPGQMCTYTSVLSSVCFLSCHLMIVCKRGYDYSRRVQLLYLFVTANVLNDRFFTTTSSTVKQRGAS